MRCGNADMPPMSLCLLPIFIALLLDTWANVQKLVPYSQRYLVLGLVGLVGLVGLGLPLL